MRFYPRVYSVVASFAVIATTTLAASEPTRPPDFVARDKMRTDLIVHRAQQGHTRVNGEINHVVTDRDKPISRPLNDTSRRLRSKKLGLQPKLHSPPVRRINTVIRTSAPLIIRTDPKRTRELRIGGVSRFGAGPPTSISTRTLGGVVIKDSFAVPDVNVVVESPSIRVVAAPKPGTPKAKHPRRRDERRS